MPKVTDAHRQARRRQILSAAFACFGQNGFHATTIQDICEEAELSPGAVYSYFEGKADIIRAIAEESRGSLATLFDSVDREQPALQVLAELIQRLGEFVEQPGDEEEGGHRVRVRLWSEALNTLDVREPFRENLDDFTERFAAILSEGQENGTVDPDLDAKALAHALLAFYQGMVLQKSMSPDTSVEPAFDAVSALLKKASS